MSNTTTTLNVKGMSCNHCVNSIKNAVGALPGVAGVTVDLNHQKVTVEFAPEQVTIGNIKETIEDQGYEVV